MTRQVRNLLWAKALRERPACIPIGRPRGARAAGVRFESALASGPLVAAQRGLWIEFADANGHGYAQCDFVGESAAGPFVAEAKLTWTPAAYVQLRGLYLPLLRAIYHRSVGAVVVCANLTRETPRSEVAASLPEALARSARGEIPVLHAGLVSMARPPREAPSLPRTRVPKWWGRDATKLPEALSSEQVESLF